MSIDFDILMFLQNLRTPAVNIIALGVSSVCNKLLLVAVFCVLFWCKDKKHAYGIAFSFILSGMVVQTMKVIFRIPRPFVRWKQIQPSKSALSTATGYSFPSVHTQIATSIFGYSALALKNKICKALLFVFIFLIMLSRNVLGVHTPTDVVVSFVISLVFAVISYYVPFYMKKENSKKTAIIGGVASAVVCALMILARKIGIIDAKLSLDGIEMAFLSVVVFAIYFIEMNYIEYDSSVKIMDDEKLSNILKFALGFIGILIIYGLLTWLGKTVLEYKFMFKLFKNSMLFVWICIIYPIILKKIANNRS